MKVCLKVEKLEEMQRDMKLTDAQLALKMGISRSRLWRAKLSKDHKLFCYIGESFIAGTLRAFPNSKFDDLFFLD